jgi:hypothetical protein
MLTDDQIREYLKAPLSLLALKDEKEIHQINSLIPYSSAFEIECDIASEMEHVAKTSFESIPNLMDYSGGCGEERFRIPNGMMGIICLWHISRQLKANLMLNYGSGIHYHVDCKTDDTWKRIIELDNPPLFEWILNELDKWDFGGTQKRGFSSFEKMGHSGSWVKANALETLEFRVGNMTFDYDVLLKRIIHANAIVYTIKGYLENVPEPVYKDIDIKSLLIYERDARIAISDNPLKSRLIAINEEIRQLKLAEEKEDKLIDPLASINKEVRNRLHKIDTGFNGE